MIGADDQVIGQLHAAGRNALHSAVVSCWACDASDQWFANRVARLVAEHRLGMATVAGMQWTPKVAVVVVNHDRIVLDAREMVIVVAAGHIAFDGHAGLVSLVLLAFEAFILVWRENNN